jgi:hypothetical protein
MMSTRIQRLADALLADRNRADADRSGINASTPG